MPRRRLLPSCDLTLHLGRQASFRRLEEAYSSGAEIFLATSEHDRLRPIGVVAKIVTLSRIPSERQGQEPEDRALLRGLRRARLIAPAAADTKEAAIARLDENAPRRLDATQEEALERVRDTVTEWRRARRRLEWQAAVAVDETRDPIARLYRLAAYEETASWTRQAMLETDDLRRKAEILIEALREELDLEALEARILRRL